MIGKWKKYESEQPIMRGVVRYRKTNRMSIWIQFGGKSEFDNPVKYVVSYSDDSTGKNWYKYFKTRKASVNYAVSYMKKHPRG